MTTGVFVTMIIAGIEWIFRNLWSVEPSDLFGVVAISMYIIGGSIIWKKTSYKACGEHQPKLRVAAILIYLLGASIGGAIFFTTRG